MIKIDDSRLYLFAGIITVIITIILALVSFYSILIVQPKIERLLSSGENISLNYKKAYIILRNPQVFARYENFDSFGIRVKNTIKHFDGMIYNNKDLEASARAYLEILLDRRIKGSRLGRNTMVFFLILSFIIWITYFYERIRFTGSR